MTNTELVDLLILHGIVVKRDGITSLCKNYINKLYEHADLLQKIIENTTFIQYPASITVRVQCVIQGIQSQPTCANCKAPLKMRENGRFRYTFPIFCSSKCTSSNDVTKQKRNRTNHIKYGSANYLSSVEGSSKRQQTLMDRYGVDNPGKYKPFVDKRNATCVERYGHVNPLNNVDIAAKQQQTNMERYGVPNVLCKDSPIRNNIEQFNKDAFGSDIPVEVKTK